MKRREFLIGAAAVTGLIGSRRTWAQRRDRTKLDRVAIMSLCFSSILKSPKEPDNPARTLDIMDLPQMYVDRYGVHNIEMQHGHFLVPEPDYFKQFLDRLAKTKSQVTNINLEFGAAQTITAPEADGRRQALERTKQWIDYAVLLGCPRIMVNQGSPTRENKAVGVETLRAMGEYGKTKNIMVAMENRGGGGGRGRGGAATAGSTPAAAGATPTPSGQGTATPTPAPATPPGPPAEPAYVLLVEMIKESGTWANCDIGNFPDQATQHAGMRAMFPLTDGNCHVKLNPARYELPAALALTKELGYKGLYSIEAGGGAGGADPYDTVQRIYDVLLANI